MTGRTVAINIGTIGATTLAHRMAEPGEIPSGAIVWHVLDYPAEVTAAEALELFSAAAIWRQGCYLVHFDQLARAG